MCGKDMQVFQGKIHNYLGMELDLSILGEVSVTIVDNPKKVITDYLEEIIPESPTQSGDHLFEVFPNEERNMLDEEWATALHHSMAQLLFMTPRARNYTHTDVDLLMKRVRELDKGDWHKLQ